MQVEQQRQKKNTLITYYLNFQRRFTGQGGGGGKRGGNRGGKSKGGFNKGESNHRLVLMFFFFKDLKTEKVLFQYPSS